MTFYRWSYSKAFKDSLAYFSEDEKEKVIDFIVTYQDNGLVNFSVYPGKITRTGSGNCTEEEREYAQKHNLWHYHVGIPKYVPTPHGTYQTSRDVLHFQWFQSDDCIRLVDMYRHYLYNGKFYMPPEKNLAPESPEIFNGGPEANDGGDDLPEAG